MPNGRTGQSATAVTKSDRTSHHGGNRSHAYPRDLARVVRRTWRERRRRGDIATSVPTRAALEALFSVSYQASLLHEEGRAVTFRLVIDDPDSFPDDTGPPVGLHRLLFARKRPLDPHELRRLAPAADFARSLIGVRISSKKSYVWGLLQFDSHWLDMPESATPRALLVVSVSGPGHLVVTLGGVPLAELGQGRLGTSDVDLFDTPAMLATFGAMVPANDPSVSAEHSPIAVADFSARLAAHVLRVALGTIGSERHGGTLIILPAERLASLRAEGSLRLKYDFVDDRARRRVQTTACQLLPLLRAGDGDASSPWQAFLRRRTTTFRDQDAALVELSHLISALSRVDGAVVLTDALEVVGFGAEIAGHLPAVRRVAHARDVEGTSREWVRADRVGTRHRSAYRLCQAVHDGLVLVVSQDGGLRMIRWQGDAVTYWAQVARGRSER